MFLVSRFQRASSGPAYFLVEQRDPPSKLLRFECLKHIFRQEDYLTTSHHLFEVSNRFSRSWRDSQLTSYIQRTCTHFIVHHHRLVKTKQKLLPAPHLPLSSTKKHLPLRRGPSVWSIVYIHRSVCQTIQTVMCFFCFYFFEGQGTRVSDLGSCGKSSSSTFFLGETKETRSYLGVASRDSAGRNKNNAGMQVNRSYA